ncbi:hypothetical protein TetV_080 [Tetraselmis virus 1]|uniref:Uncharacterized protein n=1 Tax=Tetraselmis virus 1 TaxID=2060617 RepID=A0A2P0VMQ6_9VIRU|nr:hypothetical protein QJ968_gp080 [Tetraselmis virus 1]AUF82172.1 hypothetical protein TetV_080 [Tetraselmis virus 1]
MSTIVIRPGLTSALNWRFTPVGSLKAVHLVCPKNVKTNSVGDRNWLVNTPFLTIELQRSEERERVLLGIDNTLDTDDFYDKALSKIDIDNHYIAVSEDDAMFLAASMRMPIIILTESDDPDEQYTAFFRDYKDRDL